MTYKIAIVDDDTVFLAHMEKFISTFNTTNNTTKFDIYAYSSARSFVNSLLLHTYDIVCLDYSMPHMNGVEVMKLERLKQSIVMLITSYSSISIAQAGFKFDLYRFIVKSRFHEEFSEALKDALNHLNTQAYLMMKTNREVVKVRLSEVNTFYSEGHYIYAVSDNETIRMRKSLTQLADYLVKNDFVRVNKGAYVNLHRIKSISKTSITFLNGSHEFISRRLYNEIYLAYYKVN